MFREDILQLIKKYNYGGHEIEETWSNGGTYGTCWDDDGPTKVYPEPEPEMKSLSQILRDIDPEMTQESVYIIEGFIDEESYNECDYYGGCIEQRTKTLTLDNLCAGLIAAGYGIL